MLTKEITSLQHPIVKHLVKLRKSSAYRHTNNAALVIGNKLVSELSKVTKLKKLIVEKNFPYKLGAEEIYIVPEAILQKITGMQRQEELVAEIPIPETQDLSKTKKLIALDGISGPGNLGTLLRTALAFGFEGAMILENTVDPFNEKAIAAAKGASFKLPLSFEPLNQLEHTLYLGDTTGEPIDTVDVQTPFVLVLGSESKGASPATKKLAKAVTIPMTEMVESLNVAVAGGILMYRFTRGK